MKNGTVAVIGKMFENRIELGKSRYYIEAKIYKTKTVAFRYPMKSSQIHVWKLIRKDTTNGIYPVTDIDRKLLRLQLALKPNGTVRTYILSLLHA